MKKRVIITVVEEEVTPLHVRIEKILMYIIGLGPLVFLILLHVHFLFI